MYSREKEDLMRELGTGASGLKIEEVKKHRQKYGKNLLPKKKKDSILKIFLSEFKDPIVFLLLIAIIISLIAGEVIDALVIVAIVLVDAVMGTYQENKANKTADALDKLVQPIVSVVRDGEKLEIPAEDLTIGDYVFLDSGDKISADMRIIESQNLLVDESILTGESAQVEKTSESLRGENLPIQEQNNMLFSGTTVISGRAEAVVTQIGLETELGKIADSLAETQDEKSPLTIRIEKFSRQISIMVLIVALSITILLLLRGEEPRTLFLTVIAFAVSALPEGLPLALTMALTIASNRMAKKKVIVRKLKSAESLGSCTAIASDKTGTLTVNEQTAKKILLPGGETFEITGTGFELKGKLESPTASDSKLAENIALLGVINNEASLSKSHHSGDSIDLAFLVLGEKLKVKTADIEIVERIPYESENKYSAVFYEKNGEYFATIKGSFEVVADFCGNKNLKELKNQHEGLASEGYRVIALASKKLGKTKPKDFSFKSLKGSDFAGMIGFIDPLRKESCAAIKSCHEAGIKVLMITGDHPLTAKKIASDLELLESDEQIATGTDLSAASSHGKRHFDNFVRSKTVFSRVTPLQKLEIIESLKRQGEFVAVTGDGVNDAPALKAANIGVAMGSGSDVAHETADMIVANDNFSSIVLGVKEGRVAYANIRKIVLFLIGCGLSEAIFFFLTIASGMDAPLLAVQLLWLNVVTDGIQDFALSFEKAERDILKEPPRPPEESIFSKNLVLKIIFSGAVMGVLSFIIWRYLLNSLGFPAEAARGYIMLLLVFMQNLYALSCRSERQFAAKVPLKNNYMIVVGIAAVLLLQFIISETPVLAGLLKVSSVPLSAVLVLILAALTAFAIIELYKLVAKRFETKK